MTQSQQSAGVSFARLHRSPFGSFRFSTPEPEPVATTTEPVAPVEPKPPKVGKTPAAAATVTKAELTPAELEAIREDARKAVRDELAIEQKKKDDAAAEALLVEQGKWKEIADAETKKRQTVESEVAALRLESKRNEVREQVRTYLSENHKDYVGSEKYVLPLIAFDATTAPEDVTKKIKATADQFVKDNPRTRPASSPPPPGGQHGGGGGTRTPVATTSVNGQPARPNFSGAASRF